LILKIIKFTPMKIIKRFTSGVVLFSATIMLFSCNLEDFNLKKLADPTYIAPDVFAPFAYGTFKVEDLIKASVPPDTYIIPSIPAGMHLDPFKMDKTGTSFRSSAIDSVYLVTHFTNDTPADIEFQLGFFDKTTGALLGGPFNSGKIPAGAPKDFLCQVIKLGPSDQDNLAKSDEIRLYFTLFSPSAGTAITYGNAKGKSFTIKIYFHAPVQLWKL
jgi:hypothetical protein